jgi:hypothetical protein
LYNSHHLIMGRIDMPHQYLTHPITWTSSTSCGITCLLFTFCFVKALRWWGVTRLTQPHVHTYMFCPYVISTLYCFIVYLENYKWELSKDTFLVQFFSQLYT